jgi:hypothetical protein
MVEGKRTAAGVRAHARARAAAIAGAALLSVVSAAESICAETAQQSPKDDAADTIDLGARGAPGSAGPAGAAAPASNLAISPVQFSPRAGFATEYMSRGKHSKCRRHQSQFDIDAGEHDMKWRERLACALAKNDDY